MSYRRSSEDVHGKTQFLSHGLEKQMFTIIDVILCAVRPSYDQSGISFVEAWWQYGMTLITVETNKNSIKNSVSPRDLYIYY